jgi:hypothetical protein
MRMIGRYERKQLQYSEKNVRKQNPKLLNQYNPKLRQEDGKVLIAATEIR